jgi:hypothetical protein
LVKFGFGLKRRGSASLDHWFSKSLPMVGLWQRRFQNPFRKIIKNPLNQAGDDPAKSRERFKQAFMEAFGRTENGSAKPKGRLQQMFQRIMLWRSRIG